MNGCTLGGPGRSFHSHASALCGWRGGGCQLGPLSASLLLVLRTPASRHHWVVSAPSFTALQPSFYHPCRLTASCTASATSGPRLGWAPACTAGWPTLPWMPTCSRGRCSRAGHSGTGGDLCIEGGLPEAPGRNLGTASSAFGRQWELLFPRCLQHAAAGLHHGPASAPATAACAPRPAALPPATRSRFGDHEKLRPAAGFRPREYPKPDGVTTFDLSTSLFRSGDGGVAALLSAQFCEGQTSAGGGLRRGRGQLPACPACPLRARPPTTPLHVRLTRPGTNRPARPAGARPTTSTTSPATCACSTQRYQRRSTCQCTTAPRRGTAPLVRRTCWGDRSWQTMRTSPAPSGSGLPRCARTPFPLTAHGLHPFFCVCAALPSAFTRAGTSASRGRVAGTPSLNGRLCILVCFYHNSVLPLVQAFGR